MIDAIFKQNALCLDREIDELRISPLYSTTQTADPEVGMSLALNTFRMNKIDNFYGLCLG